MASKSFKPDSSSISEVKYDDKKSTLLVTMKDGSKVRYDKVPESVYVSWTEAKSAGGFYNLHIRNQFEWEYVL